MAKYFGTYGVRRKVEELTPEFVSGICAAFGSRRRGEIVVGKDGRTSGEMVKSAAISGLLSVGCDVIDIGTVPSPTVEREVKERKADGGIIITASHNPPEWNALKFIEKGGIGISRERGEWVERIYDEGWKRAEWYNIGRLKRDGGALRRHERTILNNVDVDVVRKRKPFLLLDCGNGTAALIAPFLFRKMGCKVLTLNAQVDGFFPGRNSEPTKENLESLMMAVKALGADAGIAWDGDADRVIFIDENGDYVWGDKTFALCVDDKLRKRKGDVVTTVATSDVIKEIAERSGSKTIYTKVGAPYLMERMVEDQNAVIGGEEVGGAIWPEVGPGKDGLMTAAKVVEIICEKEESLSVLIGKLPRYFNAKTRVRTLGKDKKRIVEEVKRRFKEKGGKPIEIDGIRMDFDDSWIIARASGTEDIMRVFAEAKTQEKADSLLKEYSKIVEEVVESV